MLLRSSSSLTRRSSGRRLGGVLCQARSKSYLSPPWLLDDYIPRYQLLTPLQEARKRSEAYAHLRTCLMGADVVVNTVAPHFGEEPCIQGHNGSGSVFFSGCNLRCTFCQNHDIAHQKNGFHISPEELAEWYMKLQEVGNVHNINLVTPEHVVPQVALSILRAKELGLRVPIIYNTSSFDSLASIELMDGLVDIYLADFKTWNAATSRRLLKAVNYAETAKESIKAMHAQVGDLCFTPDGLAKKGVLIRHLVMPNHEDEGKQIVRWLAENVSKDLYVHIMEQYFPRAHVGKERRGRTQDVANATVEPGGLPAGNKAKGEVRYADINRAVTLDEVASVRKVAEQCGMWRFVEAAEHGGFNI